MENNTTEKITFYVGLRTSEGDDINGPDAIALVTRVMSEITDGYNITHGYGYWKEEEEHCLIVSFLNLSGASESLINSAAIALKMRLNQDAVLVERCPVSFRMVE